ENYYLIAYDAVAGIIKHYRVDKMQNTEILETGRKGEESFRNFDLECDSERRTDILDRIDKEAVTKRLMDMLEIRNQEDQSIGITNAHVEEIKEYLKALDLIVDVPNETIIPSAEPLENIVFTQPGI
ncbi:MAG: hypothetical protein PUE84_00685, partial [Firmicutes bacterium]|nr:hypothetical protein [Bacillota bacterium]